MAKKKMTDEILNEAEEFALEKLNALYQKILERAKVSAGLHMPGAQRHEVASRAGEITRKIFSRVTARFS